ncbi:ribonuclease D [Micromonospora sp. NPDC048898]|uniref:ribonuclease D n=1 Tax=Micromonospora sp. NPDC048898 TaxID=3364260 RepID=UPI00371E5C68
MTVATYITKQDLDEWICQKITGAGRFACDIETSGLNPLEHRIGTVQIFAPEVGSVILQVQGNAPRQLCLLLEDARIQKVFHHAMFDLRFIASHWGVTPRNISCTKIASKILNPDAENKLHSLQNLLQQRLGVWISKDQRLTDWLTPELTADQIAYAATDVEYLLQLLDDLSENLKSAGLKELFDRCVDFIPSRVRLEVGGWPDVFAY